MYVPPEIDSEADNFDYFLRFLASIVISCITSVGFLAFSFVSYPEMTADDLSMLRVFMLVILAFCALMGEHFGQRYIDTLPAEKK